MNHKMIIIILIFLIGCSNKNKALKDAIRECNINEVIVLLNEGANVNAKDNKGNSNLHLVAHNGNIELADLLITKGADINMENIHKRTPLHIAIVNGKEKLAEFLITKGANVNVRDFLGWTPLHLVILNLSINGENLVKLLITKGADIKTKDNNGTPLYWAVAMGREKLVKILKKNRARQ